MIDPKRVLLLGIGNILMGDEGVGVHAVRELASHALPDGVDVVDGGTGGFHLLELFESYAHIVILDATMDQSPPGTVKVIHPKFASDYPRTLSAHDIGLKDMVEAAAILGKIPAVTLITVSVSEIQPMSTELTGEVKASLPSVVRQAETLLRGMLAGDPVRKHSPEQL